MYSSETTLSGTETVGTPGEAGPGTHALVHTRVYLQRAHAGWKRDILMRFIIYKSITIEEKGTPETLRDTDQSQ